MAISEDTIKEHLDDPAAFCCQFPAGSKITPAELIDPELFEDMIDAGLMKLDPNVLKIGQVLGKTLTRESKSLESVTKDILVEDIDAEAVVVEEENAPIVVSGNAALTKPEVVSALAAANIKINIESAKGLTIEIIQD